MIDIRKIVRSNIWTLKAYSSARNEFDKTEGIFFDANENPYGDLNRYPDPYQFELKQELAKIKDVEVDNIFVGNGSDEVIDLALRIFCEPGLDKALTFSPTYGMYKVSAGINDVALVEVPLDLDFQIDRTKVLPYLSDESVKLIFICSPNNPTGNLMNQEDIEFILKNFRGIVLVDEAYIDFAKTDSLVSLCSTYNNLIVSQTFSKAWGLAAARLGLAYAHPEIIALYNKVKPPYNVGKLNQEAALQALSAMAIYRERKSSILHEKNRLKTALQSIGLIKHIYPSDTNFFLVAVEDANQLYGDLIERGMIVRNRSTQVKNTLRITVGTPDQNDKLISVLKEL